MDMTKQEKRKKKKKGCGAITMLNFDIVQGETGRLGGASSILCMYTVVCIVLYICREKKGEKKGNLEG